MLRRGPDRDRGAPDTFGRLLAAGVTGVDRDAGHHQPRRGDGAAARSPACRCRSSRSAARRSSSRSRGSGCWRAWREPTPASRATCAADPRRRPLRPDASGGSPARQGEPMKVVIAGGGTGRARVPGARGRRRASARTATPCGSWARPTGQEAAAVPAAGYPFHAGGRIARRSRGCRGRTVRAAVVALRRPRRGARASVVRSPTSWSASAGTRAPRRSWRRAARGCRSCSIEQNGVPGRREPVRRPAGLAPSRSPSTAPRARFPPGSGWCAPATRSGRPWSQRGGPTAASSAGEARRDLRPRHRLGRRCWSSAGARGAASGPSSPRAAAIGRSGARRPPAPRGARAPRTRRTLATRGVDRRRAARPRVLAFIDRMDLALAVSRSWPWHGPGAGHIAELAGVRRPRDPGSVPARHREPSGGERA